MRAPASLIAVALAGVAILVGCSTGPLAERAQTNVSLPTAAPAPIPPSDEQNEFSAASDAISRVVVGVMTAQKFQTQKGPQVIPTGNGSGIVISADGYILTNEHVVRGADQLIVNIGAKQDTARIIGRDVSTDLAVIKIEEKNLPKASIGDPAQLRTGEWVIAVGSPFGLDHTVTTGIVSALNRSTVSPQPTSTAAAYTNLIQTDAAINPGNSGGALGRLDGTIVGVNSITESQSGDSAGIGFAIPIDFAMSVAQQLIKNGKAVHPYLGLDVLAVDPHVSTELGLSSGAQTGALVQNVTPNSPGDKAGIVRGDVITAINGSSVTDAATFWAALRAQRIGATVPVTVMRGGRTVTIDATVGAGRNG